MEYFFINQYTGCICWYQSSWYHKQMMYDLFNHYKTASVIHDIPKSATPIINHVANVIYTRIDGLTGNYWNSCLKDFLHECATYIKEWAAKSKTVYPYFNNTTGDAFNNLKSLTCLLYSKISMA